MSNENQLADEMPPGGPEDEPREAEIERLTTLHAERIREIEADRWRLTERVEKLETQSDDAQSAFLMQTTSLQRELKEAQRAASAEQQARLEAAVVASQYTNERLEAQRREAQVELARQEARAEHFLGQLLAAKDELIAQVRAEQQAVEEVRERSAAQLAERERELGAALAEQRQYLEQSERALAQARAELATVQRQAKDIEAASQELRLERDAARVTASEAQRSVVAKFSGLAEETIRADQAERELSQALIDLKTQQDRLRELERLVANTSSSASNAPSSPTPAAAREADQLRRSLSLLQAEAQRQRQALASLEHRVEKTKDTLSFRLGYLLIHAPKSWQGLRRLPSDLLGLHRAARQRRQNKRFVTDGASSSAKPAASSRPKSDEPAPVPAPTAEHFADEALRLFAAEGVVPAARFAEFGGGSEHERAHALTRLAKAIKTSDPVAARNLAERAHSLEPQPFRAKWLAFVAHEAGEITRPAALLATLPAGFALKPSEKTRVAEILGQARLRSKLPSVPSAKECDLEPIAGSCMYVASSSLPFQVTGYTVRTQQLIKALLATGFRAHVALRPGYPSDRGVATVAADGEHRIDGVCYTSLPCVHSRRAGLDEYLVAATEALVAHARRTRPAIVHAASNHVNALPALLAARRLGLPFVYEVRGLWELTAATRHVDWESSERFALERDLETLVAQNADRVLTLTTGLANELTRRGVASTKVQLLPNSVDADSFAPRRKDPELMLRFGLNANSFTLVYAGSLLHYEGLDDLLHAVALLVREGVDVSLVLAGEGEAERSLVQLASELGLDRRVKLLGRLPPADIPGLWSVADAAAFPRKPFQVCELVSPLKPLEPMAMAIPVVVSDVAALREMVEDGVSGLWHRAGDVESLTSQLRLLGADPALRRRLGHAARERVLKERTWSRAAERLAALYRELQAAEAIEPVKLAGGGSAMSPEEKALFELRLEQAYEQGGARAVRELAFGQASGRSARLLAFCLLKGAVCCQRFGDAQAPALAREALEKDESPATLRGVARLLYAGCDFSAASSVVDRLERAAGTLSGKDEELAREVRGRKRLLAMLESKAPVERLTAPVPGRSVYLLHFSLPYTSVGYATRSHGLIGGMRAAGCDVRAYTRCGFPLDFKPELEGRTIPALDVLDGIEYRRLLEGGRRGSNESEYLLGCVQAYERVLREERPEIVHAASSYATALPALIAARRCGLPFIYEIRGFWEITRSSRDNDFEGSARYELMRYFESLVAKEADHVFTLTSAMKEELVRRGVRAENITLVHNGVDAERFVPLAPRRELAERLALPPGVPVIGYVGSFVDYEGLDDLVHAIAILAKTPLDFRVLLVGDGAELNRVRELTVSAGLEQKILLTGRVPHDQVEAYYSLIDICPFPRKPWEVCEMVSPLKPFEAMAMEKAVVVSSTHALREIVEDGKNGLVFEKGSAESLAQALQRLLTDASLRARIAKTGRSWTLANRTWNSGGKVVVDGYRALLDARAGAHSARITA
ncbi:MAG TPA: glycosyltransferase [Polyangiaceae bacterium]|nr:glycosyltransferase [Polyangiaceae bacterium]